MYNEIFSLIFGIRLCYHFNFIVDIFEVDSKLIHDYLNNSVVWPWEHYYSLKICLKLIKPGMICSYSYKGTALLMLLLRLIATFFAFNYSELPFNCINIWRQDYLGLHFFRPP